MSILYELEAIKRKLAELVERPADDEEIMPRAVRRMCDEIETLANSLCNRSMKAYERNS